MLICLGLLLFSGCSDARRDPVRTFCEADVITVTTGQLICSLMRTENGCVFRFATPEILAPLEIRYDGDVLHAVYDGIETDLADGACSSVLPLYRALCAFESEKAIPTDENIRSVTLDETEFLLYYDTEGGMPTRLETKGADGVFGFDILSCTKYDDNAESTRTDTSK